jgi:transmembrane 9 superfamily protein 2/4
MLEDNSICKTLCIIRDVLSGNDAKFINDLVREDYALDWAIDGLPAAELKTDLRDSTLFYDKGFPLGSFDEPGGVTALNTHYEIVLKSGVPFSTRGSLAHPHWLS